jgi:hypothetical protein
MKHKNVIIVCDGDIAEEVNKKYGVNIDYIAPLFWEGDYMNDSYKSLGIDENSDELRSYCWEDKDAYKLRNLIRQHLRECFPGVDTVLVDVSW